MNAFPKIQRALESFALLFVAVLFGMFGLVALNGGAGMISLFFIAVGVLGLIGALTHYFLSHKLVVKIHGQELIIHEYNSKKIIPIHAIRRVYRSVDETVIELAEDKVVVADAMFQNPKTRKELFECLETRIRAK